MSNYEYRPELENLMPQESATRPSPDPRTPVKHLDSDAYWHGAMHDWRGPGSERATPDQAAQETHDAACAVIAPR